MECQSLGPATIDKFNDMTNMKAMKPKLLIVGLGATGSQLAANLSPDWDIVGIDEREGAIRSLREQLNDNIRFFRGDGTSSLVLKKANADGAHMAVACTGDDEVNLEVLRLALSEFGITNRYALMCSQEFSSSYQASGIEAVSKHTACAGILESVIGRGKKVPLDVGLGKGELIEVEVLQGSTVVGQKLSDLHPKRWLVGAVYRNEELIVPHGDTIIRTGDKVLLIGDPQILQSVAAFIRTGEAEFPLQYGSHVVTLCRDDAEDVLEETAYVIENSKAEMFEVIACDARENDLAELSKKCTSLGIQHEFSCTANGAMESLTEEASRRDVGILILPPEPLPPLARIGLRKSKTAKTIRRVQSPALIARNTHPYKKILLVLAELPFRMAAAHLAIDIVRMFHSELHLAVIKQPDIVAGTERKAELDEQRREIENMAGLYNVKVTTLNLEGNPIHEVEKLSEKYNLIILSYANRRRASPTRPDIGMHLMHRARCSTIVLPG